MYKNVVFDLDGTILNTLGDLQANINEALARHGFIKEFTPKEVKRIVGSGSEVMLRRALAGFKYTEKQFAAIKTTYLKLYNERNTVNSRPYVGIITLLRQLKKHGINTYCLTNKPEVIAKLVIDHYFPRLFIKVIGQTDKFPVKPAPDSIFNLFETENINPAETLLIGDSDVDVQTGINAKIDVAWVKWGFRDFVDIEALNPRYFINQVDDLRHILLPKE